jgi:hypothetical protein
MEKECVQRQEFRRLIEKGILFLEGLFRSGFEVLV